MNRIIKLLEELAPPSMASEWDNIGLLVGDKTARVSSIVIALDLTNKVIDKAEKSNANLIVVHHPPIFDGMKTVDTSTSQGNLIKRLLKKDIALYAMHTNLDSADGGLNDYVAEIIGLKHVNAVTEDGIRYRIGELSSEIDSDKFAEKLKKLLSVQSIRHYGPVKKLKKVALCTGSGGGYIYSAHKNGADALVTGDVKHHVGVESEALSFPVIDAGHTGTERPMVNLVADYLKKNLTNEAKEFIITPFNVEENFKNI